MPSIIIGPGERGYDEFQSFICIFPIFISDFSGILCFINTYSSYFIEILWLLSTSIASNAYLHSEKDVGTYSFFKKLLNCSKFNSDSPLNPYFNNNVEMSRLCWTTTNLI